MIWPATVHVMAALMKTHFSSESVAAVGSRWVLYKLLSLCPNPFKRLTPHLSPAKWCKLPGLSLNLIWRHLKRIQEIILWFGASADIWPISFVMLWYAMRLLWNSNRHDIITCIHAGVFVMEHDVCDIDCAASSPTVKVTPQTWDYAEKTFSPNIKML